MSAVRIIGRTSSLYTRLALLFAEELGVAYELVPLADMTVTSPEIYGGNPALKIPVMSADGSVLFGAQNICRALAERPDAAPKRIVWPEALRDDTSRNAQELVWHCMAAQVQIVFGTVINRLPAGDGYFTKARIGLEASLRWLDAHLAEALRALPARDLSLFEASLLCLVEHLAFRGTLTIDPYPALAAFARDFGARPAARQSAFRL